MIAFQPHLEEKLRNYDKYVDAEGKTTLNIEEQMAYRGHKTGEAKLAAKAKKAKKGGKMLM